MMLREWGQSAAAQKNGIVQWEADLLSDVP